VYYTHNKGNAVRHTTSIAARTESSTWLAVEHVRAFNRDDPKVSRNTRSSKNLQRHLQESEYRATEHSLTFRIRTILHIILRSILCTVLNGCSVSAVQIKQ